MIKDFYLEATVISNHVCDGFPVSGAWGRAALTQHATRKERSGVSNSCQTSGRKKECPKYQIISHNTSVRFEDISLVMV